MPVNLSLGKRIKRNLLDQFLQNWNAQMHDSSKGRNYGLFKTDTNREKYIINLNGSLFDSMIRFRTANHKLPIETGRWNNTDLSGRKCKLCTENDLGDEYHYLLRCMRGSRKVCHRGSDFFFDVRKENPKSTKSRPS